MKPLFFNAKWIPSKENYTIEDLPKVTDLELKAWVEETEQKVDGVVPIIAKVGYMSLIGIKKGSVLKILVEATRELISEQITENYTIPHLGIFPPIAIYKEVKEDDESKVLNIVGYAIAFKRYKRVKA